MRTNPRRFWLAWAGATGAMVVLLTLAVLPPFVGEELRALLMQAFAPLCHQMPARSPHVHGVALAVCDRCLGVYLGLPLAGLAFLVAVFVAPKWLDERIYRYAGPVLVAALVPMGIDWVGPVVGWWPNTPATRLATGLFFGLPAGYLFVRAVVRGLAVPQQSEERPAAEVGGA